MAIQLVNSEQVIDSLNKITLADILANRFSDVAFKADSLLKFRDITVNGSTIDPQILTTIKNLFINKPLTAATIQTFLNNLNNDIVLVDRIILLATKKILDTPINDDSLYQRVQFSLFNVLIQKADHEIFLSKILVNGGNQPSSGSTLVFPQNQVVLTQFLTQQRIKFDKNELLITDYNGTNDKAYLNIIGQTSYLSAQNEIYTKNSTNVNLNTSIIESFLSTIDEKYYNEHLLIALKELATSEQNDACQKDIVRNRIDKEQILGPESLLDIYKRRLNQPPFNEQVKKSKENNTDLTFVVLMESLNRELPVFIASLYTQNMGTLTIALVRIKIIEKFGIDFFNKFFMINRFLLDLNVALDLELNALWTTPWIGAQSAAISAYTGQTYYAPNLVYNIPPPNGVGLAFPPGDIMKEYFNNALLASRYRNQQNPRIVIESIAEYLGKVYPKFSKTTPFPYLPNPFAF